MRTVGFTTLSAALVTLVSAAASRALPAQAPAVTLAVEGRANANPIVATSGAFVAVVWSAATVSSMDLFVAVSRDAGATFSPPVQVNRVAGDARVSGENPARIALVPRAGSDPDIVVVWTTRKGANTVLQYARSRDGGQHFDAATAVPGSDAAGMRGWHSMSVDGQGNVSVLWLDHRQLAQAPGAKAPGAHVHGAATAGSSTTATDADPTARAGLSKVYVAQLSDRDAVEMAASPCYCCKTALVNDGATRYAAWRHVFPGGERDIAFAVARAGARGFSTAQRLSNDRWKLDGCPDNGPALAVDAAHTVHAVWPTLESGSAAKDLSLFYATSRSGAPFAARVRLPIRGPAGHVQIAVGRDQTPVVVWDEVVDGERRLAATRIRTKAGGSITFEPVNLAGNGSGSWYPSIAASASGVFVAWIRPQAAGSVIAFTRLP